ncbi:hypothetical protein MPTK1_3g02620 [Marchantia polymorpha subsp. ruderalis]|uniref:Uncharacterized protein n=1 Tax=Marchantia polymorpha subsp. ruderalis TaxID=1480154 RepID=A0AAF6AWR8_MARPO|nr:hypothetical protein Mp_3g02620 [Marchantia polymorpha subsp. ruderalis]
MTIRSTRKGASSPTGVPCFAAPADVQASIIWTPAGKSAASSVEKNPVRSLGWGVNSVFPPGMWKRGAWLMRIRQNSYNL